MRRIRQRNVLRPPGLAAIVLALSVAMAGLSAAAPGTPRSPDYVIKAAYLYNFAMFVEWPRDAFASPDAPLVIGVVGSDPFGGALDKVVEGKRIDKRRLQVVRIQSMQEARLCHLLFFSAEDRLRLPEFVARLGDASILFVGEWDDTLREGGTIAFGRLDNKVSYDINLPAANRARLKVSSKLLHIARFVRN